LTVRIVEAANEAYRSGDFEKALNLYKRSSEIYGRNLFSANIISCRKKLNGKSQEERLLSDSISNNKNKSQEKYSFPLKFNASVKAYQRNIQENSIFKSNAAFVGIASIPERAESLKSTIDSLIDQVDGIGVFLDRYDEVPEFLTNNPKVKYKRSEDFNRDIGDAGKFLWVDDHEGFYFTCDDDLIYPKDFVSRIKEKIISSKYPVVVGWHGSVILEPFNDYYDSSSRRVFSFGAPRPYDTPVHILGTGCMGFHTSHIDVSFDDFETPNMADVYFARLGQRQQVPFVVIRHEKGEIIESENSQTLSIYKHSSKNEAESRHNTKKQQNVVVSSLKWNTFHLKRFLKILVIGRFKINQKGGVYKSSSLLSEYFKSLGHSVEILCLSDIEKFNTTEHYDFCLAYAPDPNRPDFSTTIDLINNLARLGCVCAVNLSFNLNPERTKWIQDTLENLNARYNCPRVFFASFSNSTQYFFEEKTRRFIIPFPKTISLSASESIPYAEREGIFLGDLAKLKNSDLVMGNLGTWLEQIKIKLPHVNIYALRHYHTEGVPYKYINVLPYTTDIEQLLNRFRLTVCLVPGATFEMVPVESVLCGTPVVHRPMPQSLSEYLSPLSVEVATPEELGEVCKNLYEREELWSRVSSAGVDSKNVYSVDKIIAQLDISIRKALVRANITI